MAITETDWRKLYSRLSFSDDRWVQGEHVSIIGPTGAGKSFLMKRLLPLRTWVTIYAAKAEDDTLDSLTSKKTPKSERYVRITRWPASENDKRILLWPKYIYPGDEYKQQSIFYEALREQFAERSWTIAIDEVSYFVKPLRLENSLQAYWFQGRSLGLTLVAATQRPRGVPLLMYDMPTHLFFFRFNDENDLERIGGIGYLNRKEIRNTVARLERHQFLYIHVPTGTMLLSKAE